MNLAFVVVVGFENLVGFQEKFSYIEVVVVFAYDTLVCMAQNYLVVNNHRQMIDNPYDEVFAFYICFVEKMDNFHYDPMEDSD